MIDFSLKHILENSPYDITLTDVGFVFQTDLGIHYRVSFDKESMVLGGCDTYQLILQNVEHVRQSYDPKVEKTVLAIVDEFFRSNLEVLLYICDTSDGKEDVRNRLFLRWFDRNATPGRFTIRAANAKVEDENFHVAIIVENRNPKLNDITAEFEKVSAMLTNNPK